MKLSGNGRRGTPATGRTARGAGAGPRGGRLRGTRLRRAAPPRPAASKSAAAAGGHGRSPAPWRWRGVSGAAGGPRPAPESPGAPAAAVRRHGRTLLVGEGQMSGAGPLNGLMARMILGLNALRNRSHISFVCDEAEAGDSLRDSWGDSLGNGRDQRVGRHKVERQERHASACRTMLYHGPAVARLMQDPGSTAERHTPLVWKKIGRNEGNKNPSQRSCACNGTLIYTFLQ